ncbi:protein MIGRI [Neisseria subflava]
MPNWLVIHVSFLLKFFLFAALAALAVVRLLPDGYRQAVHRAAKTAA